MSHPSDETVLAFARLYSIAFPRGVVLDEPINSIACARDIATVLNRVIQLEADLVQGRKHTDEWLLLAHRLAHAADKHLRFFWADEGQIHMQHVEALDQLVAEWKSTVKV